MPYLASRVPPGWEVEHIDEEAEEIDWNIRADVIAITFHTPSAPHAYDISARFRSRGTCVVMGGPHVTLVPEEAAQHADAIFVGEAEGLEPFACASGTTGVRAVEEESASPPPNALIIDR